jgi:hypothetical protein
MRLAGKPDQSIVAVLQRLGESMLRREAVVDSGDDDPQGLSEVSAHGILLTR